MVQKEIIVSNFRGLCARPCSLITQLCQSSKSRVLFIKLDSYTPNREKLDKEIKRDFFRTGKRWTRDNLKIYCKGYEPPWFADGSSIMEVMMLAAPSKSRLLCCVDGPDEEKMLNKIVDLFVDGLSGF